MSEKHSIRNGVISTVIGGVILGALGFVWPPAAHVLGAVWQVLLGSVAMPVWALCLAGVVLVALLAAAFRRPPQALAPAAEATLPASSVRTERLATPNPNAELETKILQRLVKADGAAVSVTALLRATGATKLRLQAALERLESVHVVEASDDPGVGDAEVYLTPQGRQYVVGRGME